MVSGVPVSCATKISSPTSARPAVRIFHSRTTRSRRKVRIRATSALWWAGAAPVSQSSAR